MRFNILLCQLEDDAQIVPYDACSEDPNAYDKNIFRCIGYGVIFSVNGSPMLENGNYKYRYFYRKVKDDYAA